MVLKGDIMTVTSSEMQEMIETTPSDVVAQLRTYLPNIVSAFNASPSYTATNLDNMAITKATPSNGIITFNFKLKGITVTIAYRND